MPTIGLLSLKKRVRRHKPCQQEEPEIDQHLSQEAVYAAYQQAVRLLNL